MVERTDISRILGCNLSQEEIQAIHKDWRAFYENPSSYEGTVVVDMVRQYVQELRNLHICDAF